MSIGNLKDKLEGNEIDLSLCNLTEVPTEELAEVPEATQLDLSCNLFITLPDNFCWLTHLVRLDLSKNKLAALPEKFGCLVHLEHLDLLGNDLVTLPLSFCNLRRLQWLDLNGNPLEPTLRERAGDCLDERQCQDCARNVLLYVREIVQGTEKQNRKETRGLRLKYWLTKLPAIVIVGLALAVGTVLYGSSNLKNRLCQGAMSPFCNQVHNASVRIAQQAGQLWHSISNGFL